MRKVLLPLVALAAGPAHAQGTEIAPGIELPEGATLEVRADGDLNGDGVEDIAYVAHSEDWRALTVLLSDGNAADPRYRPEVLPLIGLDATRYSRTYAHDGFEMSWNLLNGDARTRVLRLDPEGGGAAYKPAIERSFKRRTRALWLTSSPDQETVLEEMRDG